MSARNDRDAEVAKRREAERERDELSGRVAELERLLLDMGGYVGSDVFIRAANAHDSHVKCEQLTTDLERERKQCEWMAASSAEGWGEVERLREALERIRSHDGRSPQSGFWAVAIAAAALDMEEDK